MNTGMSLAKENFAGIDSTVQDSKGFLTDMCACYTEHGRLTLLIIFYEQG